MQPSMETRCVHGLDHAFEENTYGLTMPIYQTAAWGHTHLGHNDNGFDYVRLTNPTRSHLEETVSALEGAAGSIAFASGMAAIACCFELFAPGDHIICSEDLYGGTVLLFDLVCKKNGLDIQPVDTTDLSKVRAALRPDTKGIYLETPSNPMMNVTDISGCAEIAASVGAKLIVDNTFLSPYFQNPLALGADIVVHSGTKFLCGHNDTLSGFLCLKDADLRERLWRIAMASGGVLSPFDSWLMLRGIKTLALRMDRHNANAIAVAHWLRKHPKVKKVYFAGFEDHKDFAVTQKQTTGYSGMISFELDSLETTMNLLSRVKMILFAESLGGVESLVTYPMTQTHESVPEATREALGINERFIRISIGIENVNDIIADLEQALA